jgi:hypothetical protein
MRMEADLASKTFSGLEYQVMDKVQEAGKSKYSSTLLEPSKIDPLVGEEWKP